METTQLLPPDYFLNRLALETLSDPRQIDPVQALERIYEFANAYRMQQLFRSLYKAAMVNHYAWQEGSPARALIISAKLEQLMEAAYLMLHKRITVTLHPKTSRTCSWPTRLSAKELTNPLRVFRKLFHKMELPQLKRQLGYCTEAALSEFSLCEILELPEIWNFIHEMEKLIDAAYCLRQWEMA